MVKGYADYNDVDEFLKQYNLEHLSYIFEDKTLKDDDGKVQQTDKLDVVYANKKPEKWNNIFKHIIIFTNDRDDENNKTLKNIHEAIEALKKEHCEIIPELHVFVAADVDADDSEENITISDDKEKFTISKESNVDTLIFSRLGVQGEDRQNI